jgi:gliding motility associated protien GldN
MKKIVFLFILISAISLQDVFSQESTVLDGIYVKEHYPSRRVIPYTSLREADVMWNKRVWRRIDLREKQNHVLYFPIKDFAQGRKNLFEIIQDAVLNEGTITAYSPGSVVAPDDMFTTPLTIEEVKKILTPTTSEDVYDEFGEITGTQEVENPIAAAQVKFYDIKEEWFFDKQRSVMDVRIIGILPMIEVETETGEKALKDLFWIYYPEARYVFANNEVFNRANDAERRTYEDIFWKRQFASRITKVSNVYERKIGDYKSGIDALLESEKLKEEIFNVEHDLWHF